MAIEFVRAAVADPPGGATSITITPGNPTAGNLIVLVHRHSASFSNVVTPAGWNVARQIDRTTAFSMSIFYKISEGNEGSITINQVATNTLHNCLAFLEYSGVNKTSPLDKTGAMEGAAATSMAVSLDAATAESNELVIVAAGLVLDTTGWGVWTDGHIQRGVMDRMNVGSLVVGAPSIYGSSITYTTSNARAGVIASFKEEPTVLGNTKRVLVNGSWVDKPIRTSIDGAWV